MQSKHRAFTLIEIMIVVLIIGILLAIALPNFQRAREKSRQKACIGTLRQIETAKQQWAMDNKKVNTDTPVWPTDLVGSDKYIQGTVAPACPSNGTYSTNDVVTLATCSKGASPDFHAIDGASE